MDYQQGDVIARGVKALPKGAKKVANRRRGLLVEGEHTGHAHVATAEDVVLYEKDGILYASMPSGSEVVHEEHHTQTWEPGVYQIGQVREKDLLSDMVRPVID
jgi:hypothetical protein